MKAISPSSVASPVPQLEWHLYRTESGQLQHAPANRGDLTKLARCADAVLPAAVPGTAASAWSDAQAAGASLPQQTPAEAVAGDHDWWWIAVVEIEAVCTVRLHSNGIATRSAVHVDGQETSASNLPSPRTRRKSIWSPESTSSRQLPQPQLHGAPVETTSSMAQQPGAGPTAAMAAHP